MALQLNNGATTNQRAYLAAPVNPTSLAFTVAGWFYFDSISTSNQYAFSIKTAANPYALVFRLTTTNGNGTLDILRRYGAADYVGLTTTGVVSAATWHHVVWQHNGDQNLATTCDIWVDGVQRTVTQPSTTANSPDTLSGEVWNYFNRDAQDRQCKGRVRDTAIWTGAAGAFALNSTDIAALYAGGNPMDRATASGGGTLRSFIRWVGADTYDEVTATEWTLANSPTAVAAPHIYTAITETLPVTSGLIGYWSSDTGYVASTATKNNLRILLDQTSNVAHASQSTAANRPRHRTTSGTNRLIGHAYPVSGGGVAGSVLNQNNTTNHRNADVTWFGLHWGTDVDGVAYLYDAPVRLGRDANGALTVVITATGETVTPLPKRYWQSRPMPWLITVSDPGGSSNKTVTLYTLDGASTADTTTPYTVTTTGSISRIGPSNANNDETQRIGMRRLGTYSRAVNATEAASMIQWLRAIYGGPVSYRGLLVYAGSSSPAGNNQGRESCETLTYYLTRTGRARVHQFGTSATGIVDRRITCAAGTAYTTDETVYQGVDLGSATATGVVRYQNASNEIYLTDCTGTFNSGTNVVGNTSGVTRNQTAAQSAIGVGLWTASRYAVLTELLNSATDGNRVLMLYASSNEVNSGWASPTGVDSIEILKRFVTKLKADFSGLRVVVHTIMPRSGSYGASLQAFNATLIATSGYWDRVVNLSESAAFNFKDAVGVDDNGVYNYTTDPLGAYTLDDTENDNIHLSRRGAAIQAGLADPVIAAALGLGKGGAAVALLTADD